MAKQVVEMARRASGKAQKRARTMVQVKFQIRPARRDRMAILEGELECVVGCRGGGGES